MWDAIEKLVMFGYGTAIAGGLLGFMYWRHAHFWRELAEHYPGRPVNPLRSWHLQSVYFHEGGLVFNSHRGMITIRADETGIWLGTFFPASLLHKPLFIPFDEIEVGAQDWMLMGQCCELSFRRRPGLRMVLPHGAGDYLLAEHHPLYDIARNAHKARHASAL